MYDTPLPTTVLMSTNPTTTMTTVHRTCKFSFTFFLKKTLIVFKGTYDTPLPTTVATSTNPTTTMTTQQQSNNTTEQRRPNHHHHYGRQHLTVATIDGYTISSSGPPHLPLLWLQQPRRWTTMMANGQQYFFLHLYLLLTRCVLGLTTTAMKLDTYPNR